MLSSQTRSAEGRWEALVGTQTRAKHALRCLPPEHVRRTIQAAFDPLVAMFAVVVALWLRYENSIPAAAMADLPLMLALAGAAQFAAGWSQGLYAGRWRVGSFEEMFALLRAVFLASALLFVVNVPLSPRPIPLSACITQAVLTVLLCAAARWTWRLAYEHTLRPAGSDLTRVVVVGAGLAGHQLVDSFMRNPAGRFLPVALVDDDPTKRNLRISGVPVLGTTDTVCTVAQRTDASTVIIAVPSADGAVVRNLVAQASGCGLEVLILPSQDELLGGVVHAEDVRPLTEADLLGRRQIDTDLDAIAGFVTGRRVLVTGAGGSIGSELCRQLVRFAPADLVMLERDESALHAVQLSIEGRATLDDRHLVVADIRDADRLAEVFDEHRPEVVFHAAALKHLPLLEMHPTEAVKSNCRGTQNLLDAALAHDVDHFVNISTDKAADPVSVLGTSKRLAERLTAAAAIRSRGNGAYVSVRFGNVLGSRGSVLTTFRAQIEAGGPITVTDPEVTRYFMTVEEAVQLVIQAGAIGGHGESLVLDMGEPVRIDDVARRMAEQASKPVRITYTGLRPGEKLHEVLLGVDEVPCATAHALISAVTVPPCSPSVLDRLDATPAADVAAALAAAALNDADAAVIDLRQQVLDPSQEYGLRPRRSQLS
jgi:FlaA1/EpsC-like NDP-sugar epimerase